MTQQQQQRRTVESIQLICEILGPSHPVEDALRILQRAGQADQQRLPSQRHSRVS